MVAHTNDKELNKYKGRCSPKEVELGKLGQANRMLSVCESTLDIKGN